MRSRVKNRSKAKAAPVGPLTDEARRPKTKNPPKRNREEAWLELARAQHYALMCKQDEQSKDAAEAICRLTEKVEKLKAALKVYADDSNWHPLLSIPQHNEWVWHRSGASVAKDALWDVFGFEVTSGNAHR